MTDSPAYEREGRFWPDHLAQSIREKTAGKRQVVATGITPSGPIHLGNIREVLTGDAVFRALGHQGASSELVYIADTFDPLRRLYPFLPAEFEQYIGMPLYAIPDPEGCCENYAEHFLGPFLAALDEMGVHPTVYRAHQMYKDGMYAETTAKALASRGRIAEIIKEVSGRDLPDDWVPYNAECSNCKRITETVVTEVRVDHGVVDYECACGHRGEANFLNGEGKLPWRIDWPARWAILGVTVEPFGKDHAAAGGSYDSGAAIVREVFGAEPPEPIVYEWIYLKGQGAMASSTGVAVSINDMLSVASPQAVRCFVLRPRPEKHIDFDPGNGIPTLVDEYQGFEAKYFGVAGEEADEWARRIVEISQPGIMPQSAPLRVPFVHLAIGLQTGSGDLERTIEVLGRSGYDIKPEDMASLQADIKRVAKWLEKYAPEAYRFHVRVELPEESSALSAEQIAFLASAAAALVDVDWDPAAVHDAIFESARACEVSPRQAFQAIYTVILGKKHGPRAGYFISSLDRDLVVGRFKAAVEASVRP